LDFNPGKTGTVPTELMECDKLSLLSLHDTGISGNLTFCDSLGESLVVQVPDLSMCVKNASVVVKYCFEEHDIVVQYTSRIVFWKGKITLFIINACNYNEPYVEILF